VDKVTAFEAGLNQFLDANYAELGTSIAETKELTDATEETLKKAINEFKQGFVKS
jgi:F-type H+-transporting ATPase subunit alpha